MRIILGGIVAALAAGVAVIGVFALTHMNFLPSFRGWGSFPWSQHVPTGPLITGSKTVSTTGVTQIAIDASAAKITLATGGSDLQVRYGTWHPASDLRIQRVGSTLSVSLNPGPSWFWNYLQGQSVPYLTITVPSGMNVQTSLDAGTLDVSGAYGHYSANVQAGPVRIEGFTGSLQTDVSAGPITITNAQITGSLDVTDSAGPIQFSGNPGLAATFRDSAGPINLTISPSGQLLVRTNVSFGLFSSGFPGLSTGTNGNFSGTIGKGSPAGTLTITNSAGPVTLDPLTP